MKKKILIIIAAILFLLGILAAFVVGSFYGSPISRLLTRRSAQEWLNTNYAGQNLEISRTGYDFKIGGYFAVAVSPDSEDTSFAIYADKKGQIRGDDYENSVTNRWNTYWRLNNLYSDWVDTILEAEDFPYKSDIAFGKLRTEKPECGGEGLRWIETSELELDRKCSEAELKGLGAEYGKLTLYTDSDDVSVERAAEILADVKARLDNAGITFASIDFTLQYPRDEENDGKRPEGEIYLLNFPAEDCAEEGLAERVQKAYDEAKAYYDELDGKEAAVSR